MANFSKKIASTVSATAIVASAMSTSLVSAASEFLPYAEALVANNVIGAQSTEAGFRLNDQITRAELAKVAANLGQYTKVSCSGNVYADVNASLGDLCEAVETLASAGVINKTLSHFRPNDNVTRAEMTKMILGALGEKASTMSAGYADVTANLGDLAGFINRANELKCANTTTYFRPAANSSRGEAFKIASCAAKINVTPTNPVNPVEPTKPVVTNGSLTVSAVGNAVAQYVPANASSVKVGTVKLMATGGDVVVNTITVGRSGLGVVNGLKASLAQNGVIVANARSFNTTTQESIIRLNTPITLKNGSSVELDVLASLPSNGTANSQHQFSVVGTNGSAMTPVVLGLLNTTSYSVGSVTVSKLKAESSVRSGLSNTKILSLDVQGISGRDTTVHGFTITKTSGNDLMQAIANVKVYRNGVDTGAKTMITSDKIIVTGLNTKLASAETAKYELRADTIYIGDTNGGRADYTFKISNTEDVSATEDTTGYVAYVTDVAGETTLSLSGIKTDLVRVSNNITSVAPGTSSVVLYDANFTTTTDFELMGYTLEPKLSGLATDVANLKNNFRSLTFLIGGTSYDLIADSVKFEGGKFVFSTNDSIILPANTKTAVRVTGTLKDNVTATSVQFNFATTNAKNLENGNTFAYVKSLNGTTITVKAPTLDVRTATIAPSTTKIVASNANAQEIGRFALEAKEADVRLSEIKVTNASTSDKGTFANIADSASAYTLVDMSNGQTVDATMELKDSDATLIIELSPAILVNKDTVKNFKLVADTKKFVTTDMAKKFKAKFEVKKEDLNTDNGTATFPGGVAATDSAEGVEYVTGIAAPAVTVTANELRTNAPVAMVKIGNTNTDNNIDLQSVKIRVQGRGAGDTGTTIFSGATVCLRNLGSTVACGDVTNADTLVGTNGAINGAVLTFDLSNATSTLNAQDVISSNGSTDFEVFINNAPLWIPGDFVAVSVEEVTYKYGEGSTPATSANPATYVGVTSASARSSAK